jgi:LmbE family N-acetylglucosaminyl deacetylase
MTFDAKPRPCATAALSAHSDDLAFSLAGTLRDGRVGTFLPITVFTRSNYSHLHPPTAADLISRVRKEEDRLFFADLPSAQEPVWLDRADAPLRRAIDHRQTCSVPVSEEDESEVEVIARLLEGFLLPGALLIAPLALGGHIDHRLVFMAACLLHARGFQLLFYEDLPYATALTEEEIRTAAATVGVLIRKPLVPLYFPSPHIEEEKRRVVRCYTSQACGNLTELLLSHAERLRQEGVPAERVWRPVNQL